MSWRFIFGVHCVHAGYLLAEPNRVVGVRSLHSLLEKSNRKFACPGESVTYTCSVYGSVLVWSTNGEQIWSFRKTDSVGTGFSLPKMVNLTCDPMSLINITFSGVLEDIADQNTMNNLSICTSTMIVTPMSYIPYCEPLIPTCTTHRGSTEHSDTVTEMYQIACKSFAKLLAVRC